MNAGTQPRRAVAVLALLLLAASSIEAQEPSPDRGPPKPEELDFEQGVATIPDRATYEKLSFQGDAGRDAYLNDIQFVKFQLEHAGSDQALLYFMNTKTFRAHPMFMRAIGIRGGPRGRRGRGPDGGPPGDRRPGGRPEGPAGPGRQMRGAIAFRPLVRAPDGTPGVYTYDFQPNDSFPVELLKFCQDRILEKAPFLAGKLVYHPLRGGLARYEAEKEAYDAAGITVYLDRDLHMNLGYLPLNVGEAYGRLRLMERDEFPTPRDIVLYETLPNELSRVAGIITAERQTPLSHVNLRAIQDRAPNAFVTGAARHEKIAPLIGKYVHYTVTAKGFSIREATRAEVDRHLAALRPGEAQTPPRDLSITEIRPLEDIAFKDAGAFGVKTANLAAMTRFGLPDGTLPNGFGIPLSFYDTFMRHNGLYRHVDRILTAPTLRDDPERQKEALGRLRALVRGGDMPDRLRKAIGTLERSFPRDTPIRCRSSTNNEDLPGFSGAGLYGSYTHDSEDGHLSNTIKRVFASLWSFRAFEERDFYRVDHRAAAMGVLVHPSYKGEQANGVAVTTDVLFQTDGNYYLNAQIGEDLVTNPEVHSVPEEVLLDWWESDISTVMQHSNRVSDDRRILAPSHLDVLRRCLGRIHGKFAPLYGVDYEAPGFAMEVEFKISADGRVVIKQARPWVFAGGKTGSQDE